MANFNQYTEEGAKALEHVADVMQQQTGIADDLTMKNMTLLLSYGAQAEEVAKLTPLIIDFAKAKGIDEKTAFDLAGKASVGYFGTLSRCGVILDESLTKTEKYAEFIKLLSTYEGTAIAVTNNYAGSIAKLSANYGDMKEPLGDIIEQSIQQSGILQTLNGHVLKAYDFWDKWKGVLIDFGISALAPINKGLERLLVNVSDGSFLKWLIKVSAYARLVGNAFQITFRFISNGFGRMSDVVEMFSLRVFELWETIANPLSRKKISAAIDKEVDAIYSSWIKKGNVMVAAMRKDKADMAALITTIKDLDKPGFFEDWKRKMEIRRKMLADAAAADSAGTMAFINNQGARQGAMEKVFKLSKSMAQQFALSSRLEQEQTKFLLGKLGGMDIGNVGQLTAMEKKLISKQGILKETFGTLFGEYAQKQLGIEAPFLQETKVNLKIDLTDDAKKLIKIKDVDVESNRNVERALAG